MQKNISQNMGSSGLVSTGVSASTGTHNTYYLLNVLRLDVFHLKYTYCILIDMLWTWCVIAK